jgi:carbon storage regulator
MLVLSRKVGEKIIIGDHIILTIVELKGSRIKIGIEAPPDVRVHREEIFKALGLQAEDGVFTPPELDQAKIA